MYIFEIENIFSTCVCVYKNARAWYTLFGKLCAYVTYMHAWMFRIYMRAYKHQAYRRMYCSSILIKLLYILLWQFSLERSLFERHTINDKYILRSYEVFNVYINRRWILFMYVYMGNYTRIKMNYMNILNGAALHTTYKLRFRVDLFCLFKIQFR